MPSDSILTLPFLTRKMLDFEHATTFSLRISHQANKIGTITIKGMTKEGAFTLSVETTSDGVRNVSDFRIPDVPIMLSVIDTGLNFQQGDCYAVADLMVNNDVMYELCAGFIFAGKGISYPVVGSQDPRPTGGSIHAIESADPAAGAELSITVPNGRIWRPIAIRFQLVCAAAAASRRVHVVFTTTQADAVSLILDTFSDIDQIISETKNYSVGDFSNLPDRADDNDILIPLPKNLLLLEDSTITTETTALNAGDDFGTMVVLAEEFYIPS